MAKTHFNPAHIEVERFAQTLDESRRAGQLYRYEVVLRLADAAGSGVTVERLSLSAIGAPLGDMPQIEFIRLLLQEATGAIAREQAGSRPGSR